MSNSRWVLASAATSLRPLLWSIVACLLNMLCDLVLFGLGGYVVVQTAVGGGLLPGWRLFLVLFMLSLVKGALRYGEQYGGHLVAFKALESLRVVLFSKLVPQAPAISTSSESGDILEVATNDIDRIEVFFAHTIAPAIAAIVVPAIGLTWVGVAVSWRMALVGTLGVVASIVGALTFGAGAVKRYGRANSKVRGELSQHLTDTVQGLPEVLGYQLEDRRVAAMGELDRRIIRNESFLSWIRGSWSGLRRVIIMATLLGVIAVADGKAALAAAAVLVVLRCFEPTAGIDGFMANLGNTTSCIERLRETTEAPPRVREVASPVSLPAGASGVEWREVDYRYPNGAQTMVLQQVSASAPMGQHTAIVGTSGSGKSTMAKLVVRYDELTGGAIEVGGLDISQARLSELRARVAYVPQHTFFFAGTVAFNLRLGAPEASDEQLWRACELAQIADFLRGLPDGLETRLGEGGATVSGGQAQRLAVARALVGEPDVLILDEATAHLNPELAARVRASVKAARLGRTIVEITHQVSPTLDADWVIVMRAGRVVAQGRPTELASVEGPYADLLAIERASGDVGALT